jgi:hypothetical protein
MASAWGPEAPAASRIQLNMTDRRDRLARLHALLGEAPGLAPAYEEAKRIVRAFRKPAFYEVATRCNLFCEGCYYFSDNFAPVREVGDVETWEGFFAAEAARGVTMAYFVGAEPALEQERLIAASRHFPYGNIGTNGTIRIDPAIPYRIGVSVWGVDEATDAALRGASAVGKALRNYAGDPRAIILHTLTRTNLGNARRLAQLCRDNGLPLTFNMYSPTRTYLDKLRRGEGNDRAYFRISSRRSNLCWDEPGLAEVRSLMPRLMDEFPDTIVYSRAYNEWVTRAGPLYDIDPETGVARDCHSRMVGQMRYFKTDLKPGDEKCGTSDTVCSECRMYSGGWSSKFEPGDEDLRDLAGFTRWLEMVATLGRIFLIERPQTEIRAAAA